MDAANTVFVDFSKIHLTKAEYKLLCEITNSPRRKVAQPAEAERLCELGLAEMYEAVGKESRTQSLFGTSLGSEYVEYYRREKRRRVFETIKWLVPLLLSIVALVLAIRANTGGTRVRTNNGTTTSYTNTTNTNNNNNANRSNTNNTQTNNNAAGGSSQEPNGSSNNNNNAGQQNANAGGASQEANGNGQTNMNGQQNTNSQASGEAGSASGEAS